MWRISFLNLSNDKIEHKGSFSSDKDAIEWAEEQEKAGKIIALKLLVWSEYLQSFRTVSEFTK